MEFSRTSWKLLILLRIFLINYLINFVSYQKVLKYVEMISMDNNTKYSPCYMNECA